MGRPLIIDDVTILAKARALFIAHGYTLSTKVIADTLGISQATLFKRFLSKENLFFSAMSSTPTLPNLPSRSVDAKTYLTQLVTVLLTHVESYSPMMLTLMSHPKFGQFIKTQHQSGLHHLALNHLIEILMLFQREGQVHSGINTHQSAQILIEALHGHVVMQLLSGQAPDSASTTDRAKRIIHSLWQGLTP